MDGSPKKKSPRGQIKVGAHDRVWDEKLFFIQNKQNLTPVLRGPGEEESVVHGVRCVPTSKMGLAGKFAYLTRTPVTRTVDVLTERGRTIASWPIGGEKESGERETHL